MFYVHIGCFITFIIAILAYVWCAICILDYLLQWADDVDKHAMSPKWRVTKMFGSFGFVGDWDDEN